MSESNLSINSKASHARRTKYLYAPPREPQISYLHFTPLSIHTTEQLAACADNSAGAAWRHSAVADHLSMVVYYVCWRQLRTFCQRMFRNRWR